MAKPTFDYLIELSRMTYAQMKTRVEEGTGDRRDEVIINCGILFGWTHQTDKWAVHIVCEDQINASGDVEIIGRWNHKTGQQIALDHRHYQLVQPRVVDEDGVDITPASDIMVPGPQRAGQKTRDIETGKPTRAPEL